MTRRPRLDGEGGGRALPTVAFPSVNLGEAAVVLCLVGLILYGAVALYTQHTTPSAGRLVQELAAVQMTVRGIASGRGGYDGIDTAALTSLPEQMRRAGPGTLRHSQDGAIVVTPDALGGKFTVRFEGVDGAGCQRLARVWWGTGLESVVITRAGGPDLEARRELTAAEAAEACATRSRGRVALTWTFY